MKVITLSGRNWGSMDFWNVGILSTTSLHGVTTQKTWTQITESGITMGRLQFIEFIYTTLWRWKQLGPLKHWYPTTTRHNVTVQKNSTWIFTATKTPKLALLLSTGKSIHLTHFT